MNFADGRPCRLFRRRRREGIVADVLMVLAILALLAIAVLFSVRGIRAESRATLCPDPPSAVAFAAEPGEPAPGVESCVH